MQTEDACYDAGHGDEQRDESQVYNECELLGYEPATPLSGGLPKAIAWQRQAGLLET